MYWNQCETQNKHTRLRGFITPQKNRELKHSVTESALRVDAREF